MPKLINHDQFVLKKALPGHEFHESTSFIPPQISLSCLEPGFISSFIIDNFLNSF